MFGKGKKGKATKGEYLTGGEREREERKVEKGGGFSDGNREREGEEGKWEATTRRINTKRK